MQNWFELIFTLRETLCFLYRQMVPLSHITYIFIKFLSC